MSVLSTLIITMPLQSELYTHTLYFCILTAVVLLIIDNVSLLQVCVIASSSVQTIVYFTGLKKTSLYSTCHSDLEVILLIYLGINTILPGNLLSIETCIQISENRKITVCFTCSCWRCARCVQ